MVFDEKSIQDRRSHGFSGTKLNALTALRQMIEKGVELDQSMNLHGEPLGNWVSAAPVEMNRDRHLKSVRLRRNDANPQAPNRFSVHEIMRESHVRNEEASPFETGSAPEVFRGKNPVELAST